MKKKEVKKGLIVCERRNINEFGELPRVALRIVSEDTNWGTSYTDKTEQAARHRGVLVQIVNLVEGEWKDSSIGSWAHALQSLVLLEDFAAQCKTKRQEADRKMSIQEQKDAHREAVVARSKALGYDVVMFSGLSNVSLSTRSYEDLLDELEESRARLRSNEPNHLKNRLPDHVEDLEAYTTAILGLLATHQNCYFISLRCIVKCCGGNKTQAMTALTNLVNRGDVVTNDDYGEGALLGYEVK